jgi:O-antigen ligase
MKLISINNFFFWAALGILLLALFHLESLAIGALKVSHLWKGALLALLMVKVFSLGKIKASVYDPFLLLAVFGLFSLEIVYNPLNAIFSFLSVIIIPLVGVYVLGKDKDWCKSRLHFLAAFFILCFVPYELGLLPSLGKGAYDLTGSYGIEAQGSIGPFQTVHSASTALAAALLVIFYFLITSAYSRTWLVSIFGLGLYLLFNTYVRTGMVMFLVGALVMIFSSFLKSRRVLVHVSLLAIVMIPVVGTWIMSNDALLSRIVGERTHSSELESFERLGSGRGGMALDAIEIYAEANIIEKIIGMGITEQKRRMGEKRGSELVPHNGFLSLLVHNGIVGLILFLWFLYRFWTSVKGIGDFMFSAFLKSLFLGYIIMTFFQNYDFLYAPVLMAIAYSVGLNSDRSLNGQPHSG